MIFDFLRLLLPHVADHFGDFIVRYSGLPLLHAFLETCQHERKSGCYLLIFAIQDECIRRTRRLLIQWRSLGTLLFSSNDLGRQFGLP